MSGSPAAPMDLVLDASVAIKWYVPEVLATEARRFMTAGFSMHVPSFFHAECGNTIWKKVVQRRELDHEIGREILEELLIYPKEVHEAEGLVLVAYDVSLTVGSTKLALYDFIYLALAISLDCRLVTADRVFFDALDGSPYATRLLWVADSV